VQKRGVVVKLHGIDFMVQEKEIIFFLHFLELRLLCLDVTQKHRHVAQHENETGNADPCKFV
jgi:hypothetical protein